MAIAVVLFIASENVLRTGDGLDPREFIADEYAKCLHCGACRDVCDIAGAVQPAVPAEVAAAVADDAAGGVVSERMKWFASRCSLCRRCSHSCSQGVDIPAMIVAARAVLAKAGASNLDAYRPMYVDCDWNAITLFRHVYGLDFSAYRRDEAPVAFLPGCTLLNEAPEAALATWRWLCRVFGCEVALVESCCGMPLEEMGLLARYETYLDNLFAQLEGMGACKLIVACPNCLGRLAQHGSQAGISVQIVYEPMAAMGLRAPIQGDGTVTIHDSCPARGTQIGAWVRSLLRDWTILETRNCGDCSQCCGSGGAVGMYDSVLAGLRASRRRAELAETGAQTCVAYCMSSCATLFDVQELPHIRHVLELVFESPVDHARYAEHVQAMWQGDVGARCDALLADARITVGA